MILRRKFVNLSALTLVFLSGLIAAEAQIVVPMPRGIQRSVTAFDLPIPSFLGVQTENVNRDNFNQYNLTEPRGVAVTAVVANSPAKQAGLQKGDVIVRFDGEEIKSVTKLMRMIEEVAPDQKSKLTIVRGGNEQEIIVTMGKRPVPQNYPFYSFPQLPNGEPGNVFIPARPELPSDFQGYNIPNSSNDAIPAERNASGRRLGVRVSLLTPQLGDYFGAPAGYGVLIHQVDEDGNSARAGLKAGDIVLEVDGETIASPRDLTRILNKKTEGEYVVTILRNKQRQTIRVKPEAEN